MGTLKKGKGPRGYGKRDAKGFSRNRLCFPDPSNKIMNNLSNLEVSSFGLKKGRRSPDIATSPSTSHLHRDLITFSSLSGDEVGRGRRDEREKRQKDGQ